MSKPELLLPAGSVEAFHAAIEGGADAIYLGLKDFNARKRAQNFTMAQLPVLTKLAHDKGVKLFITLNTCVKNEELALLYSNLHQLNQSDIDAVIIQDWGVYYLIKKYFPKLTVHASTQMAFHNAAGANFGKKKGVERVILARELTYKELEQISQNAKSEIELFVHGALCYSFSGMCLFSSYLGGMSANRGACKQPCRRMFNQNKGKQYVFSLKDNELIDYIPQLTEMGISCLKIEGRMKSADYVYTIARAYRMALDDFNKIDEAKELLKFDIGRDKTSYFIGGNVSDAITELPNTGKYAGRVLEVNKSRFSFETEVNPTDISRVRVCSTNGEHQEHIKLKDIEVKNNIVSANKLNLNVRKGNLVYIIGYTNKKFSSKLPDKKVKQLQFPSKKEAFAKTSNISRFSKGKPKLHFRIDSLAWLRKIRLPDLDYLILNLPLTEWNNIPLNARFLQQGIDKIIIELPKFIREDNVEKVKKQCNALAKKGVKIFMIGHISQLEMLPHKAVVYSNEYVYCFNDAAAEQLKSFKISVHTYPYENDLQNLLAGKDRSGIVPLHFIPELFYSRMPVKLNNFDKFSDDTKINYQIVKRDGMTITIPEKPVSLFQNKRELSKQGFNKFLIDVSFISPSQNIFKTLIKRYIGSEQLQPSTSFNFKKGLT